MKTALVIGATGLVGSHLVKRLLEDERFSKVKTFVRRLTANDNHKLEPHLIDFGQLQLSKHTITGNVLFSALGTTLRKAGSKEEQYKIDYTYQYNFAKIAAENGVSTLVLVSSAGASPKANIFYSRMKGELERDIAQLNFKHIHIIQPGILVGEREENRLGESIGVALLSALHRIPGLKAYKPIPADTVAQAMINASFNDSKLLQTYTLQQVFDLAAQAPVHSY